MTLLKFPPYGANDTARLQISAAQKNGASPLLFSSSTAHSRLNPIGKAPQSDTFTSLSRSQNKSQTSIPIRFGTGSRVQYTVTNRGKAQLRGTIYPADLIDELTPDMEILDVCSGEGRFVQDMQTGNAKIGHLPAAPPLPKARGMDKNVQNRYVGKVDLNECDSSFFRGEKDRIFCGWGMFTYDETDAYLRKNLATLGSWLKPNGKIIMAPVDPNKITRLLQSIPSLKISRYGQVNTSYLPTGIPGYWVVLTRK